MMASEKQAQLPMAHTPLQPQRQSRWRRLLQPVALVVLTVVFAVGFLLSPHHRSLNPFSNISSDNGAVPSCPAQPVLHPTTRPELTERNINKLFKSTAFRNSTAMALSGAVKIPSMSFDDLGYVGEDPRWDVFYDLAAYLHDTFPLLHSTFTRESFNEHALLYTWKGSDPSLKPLLFMSHQDVVPVPEETLDRWTYPPFAGHYDGEYVWGRGSQDDKSTLISKFMALTALIEGGFTPERTLIMALGFDEEGASLLGAFGAKALAAELERRYGKDSMEMIVDEGTALVTEQFGSTFAVPGTAEKGHADMTITVEVPGGHSSIPPDHTAIGYLSRLITYIEEHPFTPHLTSANPYYTLLQCAAEHSPSLSKHLKHAIRDPRLADEVLDWLSRDPVSRYLVRTSQAADIVRGGVKVNALPELVSSIVNVRIAMEESVASVKAHFAALLAPVIAGFDKSFAFEAFGANVSLPTHTCAAQHNPRYHDEPPFSFSSGMQESSSAPFGKITLTMAGELEPAPATDPADPRWGWMAGAIRGVFGEDVTVAPAIMTGNTDTKFYWALSPMIFRMGPWRERLDPNGMKAHTVDERMPIEGMLDMVNFYHEFVRIMDEVR